jgi:beta-lactamase regulating signal transducer with metallopeptidase domain
MLMIDEIFYLILNMSIASCFVIAVLLLLRLYKPLPRRFVYPLWALAFFRLNVPFTLTTGWSLFNFTGNLVKRLITIETITHATVSIPASDHMAIMNVIGAAESYIPIEYKTQSLRQVFLAGSAVWAIATVAALLVAGILYALTRRELNKAVLIKDNIYCSDMLLSPILMGVFRPKIILPPGLNPDSREGKMILAHENAHRKRLDNLWRTLAIGIACLHWFNPLVWVMLKVFFEDMELSCDEYVLRRGKYSSDECKVYASTLLQFAEDKRFLISSAFGRSGVKVRIVNVLNYKRMTVIGAVASTVFLLVVTLVLITNPTLRG